jgi:tRNA-2-methylthio-N6-dimethylallyladenosine synthase
MVSHLHLPVQSGSNDVLQAMKRNHTIDVYIDKIAKLRKVRPDMHLSVTSLLASRVKPMSI